MSYGTTLEAEFFDALPHVRLMNSPDGRSALLLLLEFRTWSAKAGTDGRIPREALRRASVQDDAERLIELLVDSGDVDITDDGWTIEWQETGQKSAEDRTAQRARWRQESRHRNGHHEDCPPTWRCRSKAKDKTPVPESGDGLRSTGDSDRDPVRKGKERKGEVETHHPLLPPDASLGEPAPGALPPAGGSDNSADELDDDELTDAEIERAARIAEDERLERVRLEHAKKLGLEEPWVI